MTDWKMLRDAYGTAEDVPRLISVWLTGDEAASKAAAYELWGRLCHQETVSTASFAALPLLVAGMNDTAPERMREALILIAHILATERSFEGAKPNEQDLAIVPHVLALLETAMADKSVQLHEFQHMLAALARLIGEHRWAGWMDDVCNGGRYINCPSCGTELLIALTAAESSDGGRIALSIPDDRGQISSVFTVPIAGDASLLSMNEQRLYQLASRSPYPASHLTILYCTGQAKCPHCQHGFRPIEAFI